MSKTFTLPKELRTTTSALTTQEPCDLLFQTDLMDYLNEEIEIPNFQLSQSVVDRVLAYSKAVRVQASATMIDGVVIQLN